ncbi:MAG: hypothetical protein LUC93_09705 [Planctomycetaceae bacterium]|nr:hypothetical protein [Planctomycetaceae bacterium]
MSSDSYAWKSSVDSAPHFGQRQMNKQKQRNQRYAAELAQIRKANPDNVKVPAYLRKKPSIDSAAPTAADKLIIQKQKIAQARAKYM